MTTYQCKHGVICGPDGRCERCAKESGDALKAAFGVAPEIGGRSSMRFVAVPGIMSDINSPASVVSSEEGGRAHELREACEAIENGEAFQRLRDGFRSAASFVGDASEGEADDVIDVELSRINRVRFRGVIDEQDRAELKLAADNLVASLRSTRAALEEARKALTEIRDYKPQQWDEAYDVRNDIHEIATRGLAAIPSQESTTE